MITLRQTLPANHWLAPFRWYRRWKGGHWEHWYFVQGHCYCHLWLRVAICSRDTTWRPLACAVGQPDCEQW